MQFYPNSYGTTRPAIRLREHNDCNLPAGAPESKGGQFGKKGECGGGAGIQSTGEQPRQPGLQDVKSGEEKFHRPQRPQGLHQETPEETVKKKGRPTGTPGTVSVSDDGGTDEALQALGIDLTPDEIAEAMVSHLPGDWRVTVSGTGGEPTEYYDDGMDPDDARQHFEDRIEPDLYSEAEGARWNEERDEYDRYSEVTYSEVSALVDVAGGSRVLAWPEEGVELTAEEREAGEHTDALADLIFNYENSGDSIVSSEGLFPRGTAENGAGKVRDIVTQYLENNPDAKFLSFVGTDFDEDQRREWSMWFNGDDGQSNWQDDGQNSDLEVQSFDDWYESEYGYSPDLHGEPKDSSGSGDDAEVKFSFTGDDGTEFSRTFSMDGNGLHVHHDIFESASKGDGIAKQLFAGSIPLYDKIGVQSISTLANIDIGSYSWARYGFEAKSPVALSEELGRKAEAYFKATGLFSDADWDRFKGMLATGPSDKRFHWGVADLKFYTTPEQAEALKDKWKTTQRLGTDYNGKERSGEIFNRKIDEDAAQGIVSIGRILLADNADRYSTSWRASLDLTDDEQVQRLEGYIGKWREPQGSSEEQLAAARRAQGDPRGSGAARARAAQAEQPGAFGSEPRHLTAANLRQIDEHRQIMQRSGLSQENIDRSLTPGTTFYDSLVGPGRESPAQYENRQMAKAAISQARKAEKRSAQSAHEIYAKAGRFNTRMDAWQKQNTASGGRKLDRDSTNRVWQAVQRGVPFDKAVADIQAQIAKVHKQTRGADRENRFQKAVQRSRTNPTLTGLASRASLRPAMQSAVKMTQQRGGPAWEKMRGKDRPSQKRGWED